MRAFITGATGFIGQRLVRALRQGSESSTGETPTLIALCRSESSAKRVKAFDPRIEVARGDLGDPAGLRRAFEEARPTHVAHLAAEIATQRDPKKIEQVNVEGTRALIEACRGLELERFLFLSTVVRGECHGAMLTEDSKIPTTTVYGNSKAKGEQMLLDANRDWGLPAVILRPSHVYGPGGWFAQTLARSIFAIPGSGENLWDVVHVDDAASACALLLHKGAVGEAYHVVDDTPITMNRFFELAANALGRKPWSHVPVWLAKLIGGSETVVATVRSARSSNAKLKSLGWEPTYKSAEAGLPAVIAELGKVDGK